ncbi:MULTISPECIES: MaoC family dehydratase N-terminal domain-containing protein [unclassified Bradyrhizobium]|uniref:FAS1-like dehydratase domain-containing protein n=1 Tax=unclassified Bradyrhizobium TaxID=2631580 RepID=UPI0028E40D5E|nr:MULTISPECIES: MaoC family dehydratase N-terminal domain-containing protein [unclassified Bradyrhizobium]
MTSELSTDLHFTVGRSRTSQDIVTIGPLRGMAAMLGNSLPLMTAGEPIPPGWHWLYFLPSDPQTTLGLDGSAAAGDFLPAFEPSRRMWAGGSFEFHRPLRVGEHVERVSTVHGIDEKSGKQGRLVFVTLHHEIFGETDRAVTEEQVLVFRSPTSAGQRFADRPATLKADWSREIVPDPVLLFRFSALTFNAHRIHYDRPYAMEKEGYPGLVIHGPLQAILLLELLRSVSTRPVAGFKYRALRPIFDGAPFTVNAAQNGQDIQVWTADSAGNVGILGEARGL